MSIGPNLTGKPRIDDYWLGRGKVFMADIDEVTGLPVNGWRDVGNVPKFALQSSSDTLDHVSSMQGLRVVDLEVVLKRTNKIAFSLEEMNHENIALFFSGDKAVATNAAVAGFVEFLMVADGSTQAGMWYDLKNASGVRAYGVTSAHLTVKTNESPTTTLLEGTDYDLDTTMGRIFLRSDSTDVQDAVTGGFGIRVAITANASAGVVNEVRGLTRASITKAVKFVGENAVTGSKVEVQFHTVKLLPSGDVEQISDQWSTLAMEGTIQRNDLADANSPFFTLRQLGDSPPQVDSITFDGAELNIYFKGTLPLHVFQTGAHGVGGIKFRASGGTEYWSAANTEPALSGGLQYGVNAVGEPVTQIYFGDVLADANFTTHAATLTAGTVTCNFAAGGWEVGLQNPERPAESVSGVPLTEI